MTKTVRVPDPVFERIEREAERQDVQYGSIVKDWMDAYDELETMGRQR